MDFGSSEERGGEERERGMIAWLSYPPPLSLLPCVCSVLSLSRLLCVTTGEKRKEGMRLWRKYDTLEKKERGKDKRKKEGTMDPNPSSQQSILFFGDGLTEEEKA